MVAFLHFASRLTAYTINHAYGSAGLGCCSSRLLRQATGYGHADLRPRCYRHGQWSFRKTGTMGTLGADDEGAVRGAVGAKRCSAKGGSEDRRCSPSPVWRSAGYAPRKFLKFHLQICAFLCIFAPVFTLNLMQHVLSLEV